MVRHCTSLLCRIGEQREISALACCVGLSEAREESSIDAIGIFFEGKKHSVCYIGPPHYGADDFVLGSVRKCKGIFAWVRHEIFPS